MSFGWTLTRREPTRSVGGGTGGDAQCGCGPTEMVVGTSLARRSSAENGPTWPRKGCAVSTHASGRTRSLEARSDMSRSLRPSLTLSAKGTAPSVPAPGARASSMRARTRPSSAAVGVSRGPAVVGCGSVLLGRASAVAAGPDGGAVEVVGSLRSVTQPGAMSTRARIAAARADSVPPVPRGSRERRTQPRVRRWRGAAIGAGAHDAATSSAASAAAISAVGECGRDTAMRLQPRAGAPVAH